MVVLSYALKFEYHKKKLKAKALEAECSWIQVFFQSVFLISTPAIIYSCIFVFENRQQIQLL